MDTPTPTRRIAAALLVIACQFPASSCGIERKGGAGGGRGPVSPAGEAESPFAPVQLAIHPLSRVAKDPATGEQRFELYLELRDRWEDSVKWLGEVVIELFRDTPPVANAGGGSEQVKRWRVDLVDTDANVRAYDRVTRTYRLSLVGVPEQRKQGSWKLDIRWTLPEGRALKAAQRFD